MKKTLLVALMVVAFTGVASAATLSVPFFNDSTTNGITFIAVHNNLNVDIPVSVHYYNNDGTEDPPVGSPTFILTAYTTLSFRPAVDDAASEGPGNIVPDKPGAPRGSMYFEWFGAPADIQGRLHTQAANGSQFSYLLPPGASQ